MTTKLVNSKWIINTTSYIETYRTGLPYVISASIHLEDGHSETTVAMLTKKGCSKSYNFTYDIIFEFDEVQSNLCYDVHTVR